LAEKIFSFQIQPISMMEVAAAENFKAYLISFVISILSCLYAQTANSQTTTSQFEVVVAGFNIGRVTAEEIKNGEVTEYHVNSKVSFWFFGQVELGFTLKNVFHKGILMNSKSLSKTNRGDFESFITWKDSYYDVKAATYKFENNKPVREAISQTSGRFYFHEPKDGDKMISETYGLVSKVIQKSPGVYEINLNGNRNQFHYVNGKLDKIVIQFPIKNFVVKRIR
jgi:hypothetical protein